MPQGWFMTTGSYGEDTHGVIFEFLRSHMARIFARNVTKSLRNYLSSTYTSSELLVGASESGELQKDLASGKLALTRARGSTFWEWNSGSSLFFLEVAT